MIAYFSGSAIESSQSQEKAIAAVLMAEGMEVNVAKQQAAKAAILSQGLNNVQVFKRVIGDLPKELLLS